MRKNPKQARSLRDRQAGVTVLFATALVPIILLLGLVYSYSFATLAKQQLDLAADTAAMAAASTAARGFVAQEADYISQGNAAGDQWFQQQSANISDMIGTATDTVNVTQTGGTFQATVSYSANIGTFLSGWFGGTIQTKSKGQSTDNTSTGFSESNTSVAIISTNAFVNVDFLLDNSSSMMIGATEADIQQLAALLYQRPDVTMPPSAAGLNNFHCAFACHWTPTGGATDYYALARAASPKVTLRWDVLQTAMQGAITDMQQLETIPGQFSVGVYSFGDPAAYPLKTIYPDGSTDLAGALPVVAANTSPVVIDAANTDFPAAMKALSTVTTPAGDGSTAATPKKALIIITDGMADYGSRSIPSTEGPLDPANCQAMKDKGYTVYVLYTSYSTDYPQVLLNNQQLATYINGTSASGMVPRLQACSSNPATGFIQASNPADIYTGLNKLLQVAVGSAGRYTK